MKRASWTAAIALALWVAFPAPARGATGEWRWPVRGPVITHYRNDDAHPYAASMHRGIDIAAAVGTKVAAARAGTVTYAGKLGSSGSTVAIVTADGRYATSYLHLSRIDVARGTRISAGGQLGAVGTSGRRSAPEPHLHFGVRIAGSDHDYRDPLALLPPLRGGSARGPTAVPVGAPAPLRANEARVPRAVPTGPPSAVRERIRAPVPVPAPVAVPARLPHPSDGGRDWGRLLLIAGAALLLAAMLGRPLFGVLGRLRALREPLRAKRLGDRPDEAPDAAGGSTDVPAVELVPQLN